MFLKGNRLLGLMNRCCRSMFLIWINETEAKRYGLKSLRTMTQQILQRLKWSGSEPRLFSSLCEKPCWLMTVTRSLKSMWVPPCFSTDADGNFGHVSRRSADSPARESNADMKPERFERRLWLNRLGFFRISLAERIRVRCSDMKLSGAELQSRL